IMPISSFSQIQKFSSMCGVSIPQSLKNQLAPLSHQPEQVANVGANYAYEQCKDLLLHGVEGIHLYTLNKSHASQEIISRLRREGILS
ncbi:MAG: methylenetetrahydrofolate reductase, partial [Elusimicrobia bacterium]|nr:methylenetetrahydrofolate reductase [Elusimicrobiota bacterium]